MKKDKISKFFVNRNKLFKLELKLSCTIKPPTLEFQQQTYKFLIYVKNS